MKALRKAECCPTCGRPLLPEGFSASLGPIQRRIVSLVEQHGEMHREALWDAIYGSDPDGGPISPKILDVHIIKINRQLRPHGLAIKRRTRGWDQPWRLVPILEAAE